MGVAKEGELAELVKDEVGVRVGGEASLEGLEVMELGGGGEASLEGLGFCQRRCWSPT